MNTGSIVAALRSGRDVDRAVNVLFNFDAPLTERELETLAAFAHAQHEAVVAGTHLPPTPPAILPLLAKPSAAVSATFVLQCVLAACKIPSLSSGVVRRLVKLLVPSVAKKTAAASQRDDATSGSGDKSIEWAALLKTCWTQLQHASGAGHCERTVQCAVAFLDASEAALPLASSTSTKADAEQQQAAHEVAATMRKAWAELAVAVVLTQAKLHATRPSSRNKQSLPAKKKNTGTAAAAAAVALSDDDTGAVQVAFATGNATYFSSDKCRHLQRLVAVSPRVRATLHHAASTADSITSKLVVQVLLSASLARASASPAAASSLPSFLTPEAGELFKLQKQTLSRFVQSGDSRGSLERLVSRSGVPGRLIIDDAPGTLQWAFETLALTTTALASVWDILSVVAALPSSDVEAYVAANPTAFMNQLLNIFINNHQVISSRIAGAVCEVLARGLTRDTRSSLLDPLAKLVTSALQTRCHSGSEKASLLILLTQLLAPMPSSTTLLPTAAAAASPLTASYTKACIADAVRHSLDAPAPEVLDAAWDLLAAAPLALDDLKPTIASLVKTAGTGSAEGDALRRKLLLHIPATQGLLGPIVTELMAECESVETFRVDAFLALGHAAAVSSTTPAQLTKVLKVVNQSAVLALLATPTELEACASVAIALANRGIFDAVALLLTHKSGRVRNLLRTYVASIATDASTLSSLWDSMLRTVFGLDAPTRPLILSAPTAQDALTVVGAALLCHSTRILLVSVLTELLLCCGHDAIQGDDEVFFQALDQASGRYRQSSVAVSDRILARITKPHTHQLNIHATAIATALGKRLLPAASAVGAPHMTRATCRAIALLLNRSSALVTVHTVKQLVVCVGAASEMLRGLIDMDAAIVSGAADSLAAYVAATLTEKGVLKVYTPKPPKGMSDDDYEDMKKKDGIALQKAKAALDDEIRKRGEILAPQIVLLASPFLCLRLLGFSGMLKPEGLSLAVPPLLAILVAGAPVSQTVSRMPAALRTLAMDAVTGLCARTPISVVARQLVFTTTRLAANPAANLTAQDVSQLNALAVFLRQRLQHMLPAPLFTLFIPFVRVAFRCGTSRTAKVISTGAQHQLLSIFVAGIGQPNLPHPGEAASLLLDIVAAFPPLYKTVLSAVSTLAPHLPLDAMEAFFNAAMTGTDLVKEAGMIGFSKTAHFAESRKALLIACVMTNDSSQSVATIARNILAHNNFELDFSDWQCLLDLLTHYGQHGPSIKRVSVPIKALIVKGPATTQSAWVSKIIDIGGIAAVRTIEAIAPALIPAAVAASLSFLCDVADQSSSTDDLMQAVLNTGKVLLSGCSAETLTAVTAPVHQRLKKPPTTGATADHKERYNAIVVVWLTIIACRMNDTTFLEQTVDQQALVLNSSTSATVHEFVCECMGDIARNAKMKMSERLTTFAEKCINVTLTSGAYAKKKAHALGLAGVVSGLGLKSLTAFKVLKQIQAASKDKAQAQKSGAFMLMEALADVLGYSFEPYALTFIPLLLDGVAEKDAKISDCADDAAKAVMRNLSDVGLRQMIPRLVEGLMSEQTKKRTPSLNFIGYVAFCSPRQLAATLPYIMSKICECLFDANGGVANAAFNALKKVAGVVSNPEIQEHVEVILTAMRNPSSDTDGALDALMYTRFVHAVDPASLALIIPVVTRGLSDQMTGSSKGKSAQIVASMVSLVTDTKTLVPYAGELVRKLQAAAQDPLNEVRSTSAKAIASLCATIGTVLLDSVTEWVFAMLHRNTSSSAEKAGSAQVLVEVIASCGDRVLAQNFTLIEEGMNNESPTVKDSFMHIMVYAPPTLSVQTFQDFLPAAFPWVLRGLSDINEKVRTTALVAGSTIIAMYGSKNLALVLHPLLEGVLSEVSNLRQSSLLLAAKLLIHLVTIIKKRIRVEIGDAEDAKAQDDEGMMTPASTEDLDDTSELLQGGEVKVETARDAEKRGISILGSLEEQIGTEQFVRIIAAMHVGRVEHNLTVRSEVITAWQICVASPRAALSKVFPGIITLLVKFASSPNPECVDVAESCIDYTCARMGEMLEKFINAFADQYKEGSKRHKIGSLTCLAAVIPFGDAARIMKIGGQIVGCVLPAMQDEDEDVQRCGGFLFERVSKVVGSRLIESVVESQIDSSVRGVIEVVKVRPVPALAVIFRILGQREAYTYNDLDLLESIMEIDDVLDEQDVVKYYDRMSDTVVKCIVQGVEGAEGTMTMLAEYLPNESAHVPLELIAKVSRKANGRAAAARAAGAYVMGVNTDLVPNIEGAIRILVGMFGDSEADVRRTAVEQFVEVLSNIDKRVIEAMDEDEKADLIAAKRTAGRYTLQLLEVIQNTLSATARAYISADEPEFAALSLPKLFDTLLNFYSRALDYGTSQQKIQAVECIQDLLSLAPGSIGSTAVSTVSGKIAKVLYVRNEGAVVAALVRLCVHLLKYPMPGGKEKMMDSTFAQAMFTAMLCDLNQARALVLHVAITIIRRSPVLGEIFLGSIVSKKASVDNATFRGAMCRYASIVMRYAKIEKKSMHVTTLLGLIKPIWDQPETTANAVAAGSAIGSLCISAALSDDDVVDIAKTAITRANTRNVQSVGSIAAIASLCLSVPQRLPPAILSGMLDAVHSAAGFSSTDKLATIMVLRAAAALMGTAVGAAGVKVSSFHLLLKRIDANAEEAISSTAAHFVATVQSKAPAQAEALEVFGPYEMSTYWGWIAQFDGDLDDEAASESTY